MSTVDEVKSGVNSSDRTAFTLTIMRCLNAIRDTPVTGVNVSNPESMEFQVSGTTVMIHMKCNNNVHMSLVYTR